MESIVLTLSLLFHQAIKAGYIRLQGNFQSEWDYFVFPPTLFFFFYPCHCSLLLLGYAHICIWSLVIQKMCSDKPVAACFSTLWCELRKFLLICLRFLWLDYGWVSWSRSCWAWLSGIHKCLWAGRKLKLSQLAVKQRLIKETTLLAEHYPFL